MKAIRIYKFIISCCALISLNANAQTTEKTNDTIKITYPDIYGLRIGTDLYTASKNLWDKGFNGFEVTADYRINKNWYAAAEVGFVDRTKQEDRLNFTTTGSYLKIGVDRNIYDNWLNMNNMIFIGARYGLSLHEQRLNSFELITQSDYFNNQQVNTSITESGLTAHWLELMIGHKVEISKNLFLGMTLRLHALVYQQQPEAFENLYIPGFGQKYSGNIGASFNYNISYLIPFSKKDKKISF